MAGKWNLVVDVALCENCQNCVLAAKDEYVGNSFPGYAAPLSAYNAEVIHIKAKRRGAAPMADVGYMPTMCNHCDNAPCMKVGGEAVRKREDGLVLIDPEKAKGRRDIAEACPYGAIVWNEELQIPQNWIFDAHLLDQGWTMPRCQHVCPTGALTSMKVSDSEMQRYAKEQELQVLRPELATKPRVYYRNYFRYGSCFIGGSVSAMMNGVLECVVSARVQLHQQDRLLGSQTTDRFGEFKFDGLEADSGQYAVTVADPGWGRATAVATLGESCYLGDLRLSLGADEGAPPALASP